MNDIDEDFIVCATMVVCFVAIYYLIEKAKTKSQKKSYNRRYFIRPDNRDRHINSFFIVAFNAIKQNPEQFFKYTRLSIARFDILLSLLKQKLSRRRTCYTISPEARLAITSS